MASAGDVGRCGWCGLVAPGAPGVCDSGVAWLCSDCQPRASSGDSVEQGSRVEDGGTRPEPSCNAESITEENRSVVAAGSARAGRSGSGQPASNQEGAAESEVEELLRLAAAGEVVPVAFELPPLPPGATEPQKRVVDLYRLVRGLRLAVCDERDVPFSVRFVAKHTGLPLTSAWRTLQTLVPSVLERVGWLLPLDPTYAKGTALYAPGALPGAPVSVERRAVDVGDALEPEAHLADEAFVFAAQPTPLAGLDASRGLAGADPIGDVHAASFLAATDDGREARSDV